MSPVNRVRHSLRARAQGFTLIELMIVVVIVAILATIAVPGYQQQVRQSRRAQAKADLVELAQVLERRYSVNNSYSGALPFTQSPREAGATARYSIGVMMGPAGNTFELVATPKAAQAKDSCGVLKISNTGQKKSEGDLADCW